MSSGLNGALNTSLNGLGLNETAISVLGNNVANAGTIGFKASDVLFKTQLSQTLTIGSAPTQDGNGGTNPQQIGLGAAVASIRKDFTQGAITTTNNDSDLAIQGDGFFIVDGPAGNRYTRNGNFTRDENDMLVNSQGLRVQGYGVNTDYSIDVSEGLKDIEIRIGSELVNMQTKTVEVDGSLLATSEAELGDYGSLYVSEALFNGPSGPVIDESTLLVNVCDAGGASVFTEGEVLAFTPKKGGKELDAHLLPTDDGGTTENADGKITADTTIQDLLNLLNNAFGIQRDGTIPDDGGQNDQPGVSVIQATGEIQILGNSGTINQINDMDIGRLTSDNASVELDFSRLQDATGESAATDLVVFDSLGEAIDLRVSVVLESKVPDTVARYYVESIGDSGDSIGIANGTIEFDENGDVKPSTANPTFNIERDDTDASTMKIMLDFSGLKSISPDDGSKLTSDQDGFSAGTLIGYGIDEKGVINGAFDNGENRPLGQIALARFNNPQGLLENGEDTYIESVNSGEAMIDTPGSSGYGTILGGSIELSNADIGKSMVDLIVASTNYRGNARVISAVNELVDELLLLGR